MNKEKYFYEMLNDKLNFFQLFTPKEDHHPAFVDQLVSDYKNHDELFKYLSKQSGILAINDEDNLIREIGAKGIAIDLYSRDFAKFLEKDSSNLVLGFANTSPYVAFDHSLNITNSELVLVMQDNKIISPVEFAKEKYSEPVMKILDNQYNLAESHLPSDFKSVVNQDTVNNFVKSYFVNSTVLNNARKF